MIISYSSVLQCQPEAGLNNSRLLKLQAQRGAVGQEILGYICGRGQSFALYKLKLTYRSISTLVHPEIFIKVFLCRLWQPVKGPAVGF